MSEGKIIFQGKSPKGRNITIRYSTKEDVRVMHTYINALSKEKTFISYQGEKISLKDESKYLNHQLEKIQQKKAVFLLALGSNQLIGVSGIEMRDRVEKHVGVFGISLVKELRGEGIGSLLMEKVLAEAKKNLPQLQIITLGCFANNKRALAMYKKFGFIEYGKLPGGILHRKNSVDYIHLCNRVRES